MTRNFWLLSKEIQKSIADYKYYVDFDKMNYSIDNYIKILKESYYV